MKFVVFFILTWRIVQGEYSLHSFQVEIFSGVENDSITKGLIGIDPPPAIHTPEVQRSVFVGLADSFIRFVTNGERGFNADLDEIDIQTFLH